MEAAYLYDAVMIYAQALHETFEEGRDPRNGTALIERIRNKTYRSIQGFDVSYKYWNLLFNFLHAYLMHIFTCLNVKSSLFVFRSPAT